MEQLSFFDAWPEELPEELDDSYLDEWALVYLVTRSGGNQGNLFLLKTDDARVLCSDECSHGQARGGFWMFQWTTIRHFVRQNEQYDNRLEDFVFIWDTGRQDKDFEKLGIRKPSLKEQCDILHKLGYVMTFEGKHKEDMIKRLMEGE